MPNLPVGGEGFRCVGHKHGEWAVLEWAGRGGGQKRGGVRVAGQSWTLPYTLLHSFTCIDAATHTHLHMYTNRRGKIYRHRSHFFYTRFMHPVFFVYKNPPHLKLVVCSILLTRSWNTNATCVHPFEGVLCTCKCMCVSSGSSEHTQAHTGRRHSHSSALLYLHSCCKKTVNLDTLSEPRNFTLPNETRPHNKPFATRLSLISTQLLSHKAKFIAPSILTYKMNSYNNCEHILPHALL